MLGRMKRGLTGTWLGWRLYRAKRACVRVAEVIGARAAILHYLLGLVRIAAWTALRRDLEFAILIKNRFCPAGVELRCGSTDWQVFRQVFVEREYDPLCSRIPDPEVIIDLGANVGYSTVYFLERYPNVKCICLEPDPRNFHLLLKNTARYGGRVRLIEAAVWRDDKNVCLIDRHFVGNEWGIRVVENGMEKARVVRGISMNTVLSMLPENRAVDILKIDIEGSEDELFEGMKDDWLSRIRSICIELHTETAKRRFHSIFDDERWDIFLSGELTVAVRRQGARVQAVRPAGGGWDER